MPDATPIFQTKAHLQGRLRLSSIVQNSDADEQLDGAIREARLFFWLKLGTARVAELAALAMVDPPVTDADHLRKLAEEVEYLRIRWTLLDLYAAHFKEGSSFFQEWNDEAFRSGAATVVGARKELLRQITESLELLSGTGNLGDPAGVRAADIGIDESLDPPVVLGESVFATGGIFNGLP